MRYSEEELYERIEEWRESGAPEELYEFLDWTYDEYKHWGETNEQPDRDEE